MRFGPQPGLTLRHETGELAHPGNLSSTWKVPAVSKSIPNIPHFLVHSPKDNVGVIVIEGLKAGTDMHGVVTESDSTTRATANHAIPIGHKVALKDLAKGDTVIKYGEDIGIVVASAKAGDHIHVHNMKTKRW